MTGGILSYQLCERGFDCDHCPLDAAIRCHFKRPERGADESAAAVPVERPASLPGDRLYSRNHCWVRVHGRTPERHRLARVGIEPGLADALLAPKAVVLPSVGEHLKRRRTHMWIVTDGGTFPISAPTDGVVSAVNANLAQHPYRLGTDPLEEGWAFEMDVCENELRGGSLLATEQAKREFRDDHARFQNRLADALRGESPRLGATLADGGVALQHVSDMLGAVKYFTLLQQAFR
ncbi:MAG: hypothetical protein HZB25_14195 [Candidatus Eisenbacteria bacterium]|nr:hypothetical protein [Candidatus Eisenbacteria bacterium]